jgi:hypothetical protein
MKPLICAVLGVALTLSVSPSQAGAPEPTYQQTRDWIVATLNNSAGYSEAKAAVSYKNVSMEGCQLRFTTLTETHEGYTDTDTFTVPLDSVKSVLWGTVNNPPRGYVLFTTESAITFSKQRVSRLIGHAPESSNGATRVGAIEFGRPGGDYAELASQMKSAIVRAASLCKVQIAAN